ncbi:547_t:CDS:2, partial [Racocetra fulgida]
LNRHKSVVKKYNIRREGLYALPLEAKKEKINAIDAISIR